MSMSHCVLQERSAQYRSQELGSWEQTPVLLILMPTTDNQTVLAPSQW